MHNFKKDYLQNKINYEDFSKYVDYWNNSNTNESLQDFLGLTDREYKLLLDDGSLKKELNKEKEGKSPAGNVYV